MLGLEGGVARTFMRCGHDRRRSLPGLGFSADLPSQRKIRGAKSSGKNSRKGAIPTSETSSIPLPRGWEAPRSSFRTDTTHKKVAIGRKEASKRPSRCRTKPLRLDRLVTQRQRGQNDQKPQSSSSSRSSSSSSRSSMSSSSSRSSSISSSMSSISSSRSSSISSSSS